MAEDPHPPPARATPATAPEAPDGRGRVLVAEDNTLLRVVTVTTLRVLGYDAEVVPNGREAVEAVERSDYVAVLMDCQMPEMDGYQATAEIRRREAGLRRIPIIALTASWMQDDREACLAAGMDDYLTKPARKEQIGAALQRWIGAVDPALQQRDRRRAPDNVAGEPLERARGPAAPAQPAE